MKTSITILGCGIAAHFSYAQTAKSQGVEIPTSPLTIEKVAINTQIPTESIIDLRDLLGSPIPSLNVLAVSKEKNTYQVLDEESISTCKLSNDSLWLYEKETPLTKLVYNHPELKLTFPLNEGKFIADSASGKGYYADKLKFKFYVTYKSSVSTSNDIIMPDGSKLENIYRVKNIRNTSYSNLTSDSIESTIREEENFWYRQGELFPILSTYEITGNTDSYRAAYYVREPLYKAYLNEIAGQESYTKRSQKAQALYSPLEYKATNHEDSHEIEVTYKSKDNTKVTFTIASFGGITYQSKSYMVNPDEERTYSFNYQSLPRGEYIVRIGINDQQFNIKFNVK